MFSNFVSLTRFQKATIQEHNHGGLTGARTRGRIGGRKAVSTGQPAVVIAESQRKDWTLAIVGNSEPLGTSRPSFHRDLAHGVMPHMTGSSYP
ncbi:MAG: hypothetical protein OXC69_04555 [Candidatus Tectomicrobia bacterium]|nr:hypothetical protein [Candidatus Tectomicrobia bacterium]